jgi:hypothetical protein
MFCQERLSQCVVDLVSTGMVEVLPFEEKPSAAVFFADVPALGDR